MSDFEIRHIMEALTRIETRLSENCESSARHGALLENGARKLERHESQIMKLEADSQTREGCREYRASCGGARNRTVTNWFAAGAIIAALIAAFVPLVLR